MPVEMKLSVQNNGNDLNLFLDLVNNDIDDASVSWRINISPAVTHLPGEKPLSADNQVCKGGGTTFTTGWTLKTSLLGANGINDMMIEATGEVSQSGNTYAIAGGSSLKKLVQEMLKDKDVLPPRLS